LKELNRYQIGWLGYFCTAPAMMHCERLDKWIRSWQKIGIIWDFDSIKKRGGDF
jgi:hypothetical protein